MPLTDAELEELRQIQSKIAWSKSTAKIDQLVRRRDALREKSKI